MGSASSRQRITQPLLDAASSLLRRTQIWDKFQNLVQRIKDAVGLGQNPDPITIPSYQAHFAVGEPNSERSDTISAGQGKNQPSADASPSADLEASGNTEPDGGSSARNDQGLAEYRQQSDARDSTDFDVTVDNINRALENAAPRPPAAIWSQNTESDGVPSIQEDEDPSDAEPHPVFSVSETYESRVDELDAVFSRVVPQSARPPKPKAKKSAAVDDYQNEVAEYVFSSLMVALPQPQSSSRDTAIAFQPPVKELETRIVHTKADFEAAGSSANTAAPTDTTAPADAATLADTRAPADTTTPADTAAPIQDESTSEPEVEAVLVNYRTWDRELYSKLRLDQFSIRLVEIIPGSPDDEISVRMTVHALNDIAMQYEALSYVWGNPEPAKKILVNKVEVAVNPNLYDALISLRQRDSSRRIWIDAICLNQTSFAERSKEVQKMGQIYSLAKTVNIFLGAPSPSASTSIDSFFKFLNRDDRGEAASRFAGEGLKGLDRILEKYQTDVQEVCKGFMETCHQPWWGRIWTLQEFYLAEKEPVWYWGREHASNASLKRDFGLLVNLSWSIIGSEDASGPVLSDLKTKIARPIGSFKTDVDRISALISRRYRTNGFDTPRRLYRELTARATNPRDFVYGLRAILDPVFGRVFVPDYTMRTELLFACLAVFLIQFECWGDVLSCYPARYSAGSGLFPSWLPDFTQHIVPHELDVQPLELAEGEKPEPKLVVLNHRLHAEGYVLDKVYAHRHLDKTDGQKIFEELWQFDHCMNNNHECHEYFIRGANPEDVWLGVFLDMYKTYYSGFTHFNSAFRGAILQSTVKPENGDKLPRQVAECMPCWDVLQWHALRIATPGLLEALLHNTDDGELGCLENIFSPRIEAVFRKAFADFFIGACIYDWPHLSVWLSRFTNGTQWAEQNDKYWSEIRASLPDDTDKRAKVISEAYNGYQSEIWPEVSRVSWCYSFYYALFAYIILLDCDAHSALAGIISRLQKAGDELRSLYSAATPAWIEDLASAVPSVAARVGHHGTVVDLFRGRYLLWTDGGFRGISCPGVDACCDKKSVVAMVDGLSFPVVVRDFDAGSGEGWLAGCVLVRGVDMLGRDAERAGLPEDYERGEKRVFKFR